MVRRRAIPTSPTGSAARRVKRHVPRHERTSIGVEPHTRMAGEQPTSNGAHEHTSERAEVPPRGK